MLTQVLLQAADQLFGFPTGFDVAADLLDEWLRARAFTTTLKFI